MNIVMMTNTYTPFVGGVARSVETFTGEYRKKGHNVLVVAPEYEDMPVDEEGVVRIRALQNFNGTDFSVPLPVPGILRDALKEFRPDVIHSHHPFLLGDAAIRAAAVFKVPVVFTNHTRFEKYLHYLPFSSETVMKYVIGLVTGYANLCDHVVAPSESIADMLRERGVEIPVTVVPTGIDYARFRDGDGTGFRRRNDIPDDGFVVGFVSRIVPEKNMEFLARSVVHFIKAHDNARFLMVGEGESMDDVRSIFNEHGCGDRLHAAGTLEGDDLVDAYHAMDVFVFASKSETQGLVLLESMAAGVPVIGLDATGTREVIRHHENGLLITKEIIEAFVKAMNWIASLPEDEYDAFAENARTTAADYTHEKCAEKAILVYEKAIKEGYHEKITENSTWDEAKSLLKAEWEIIVNMTRATGKFGEEEE